MISLDIKDMSIKGILEQIEKESGYSFFYNNQLVDVNRKVSISVKNENIFSILDRIFKDANIEYSLVENRIVLSPKKQDVQEKQKGDAVSGKVLDVSGNPIIGASILVQGTSTGTITDLEGNYSLRVPDNTVLVISSIGFVSQTVTVGKQTTINVTLEDDKQSLNEVVVVGYGTQRKGNLTGAISSVKSNELNVAPSSSAINSLTGRLSGLVSKQSSGQPGHDQANIKIRGFSDDAIWIVDGIEMDFNRIDPSQIESISILKDASASIYGSRAGNGVILVTTKRGLTQKPTITVNSSLTFQGITTMPKPVSSGQYATLQREAWLNAGNPESTAPYTEEQIQKYYAGNDPQYVNTDWYKYLVRKWSPLHKDNISVRGGTEKIKYYGFLGYMNQESIWKRNGGNYEKFNLQSNIDASITDRFTLQLDISAIKSIDKSPMRGEHTGQDSVWQDFWNTLPIYPAELPDKTKISYADGKGTGGAHVTTNMALSGYSMNENLSFDGTIALKYESKFVEGLSAKYFANYYKSMTFSKVFSKPSYFYRYDVASDTYISAGGFGNSASIRQTDSRNSMLTQQISLNFEKCLWRAYDISSRNVRNH
jgi:TonB-linked SusC/RagA family outer membrane protein